MFDKNLPICFAESSFANEMLNKNDIEHINTKRSFKFRCEMARVFRKKATRDRFDGLAPTYGPAAWARFLAEPKIRMRRASDTVMRMQMRSTLLEKSRFPQFRQRLEGGKLLY